MIVWAVVVLGVLGFTMWSRLSKKSETTSTNAPPKERESPPAPRATPIIRCAGVAEPGRHGGHALAERR